MRQIILCGQLSVHLKYQAHNSTTRQHIIIAALMNFHKMCSYVPGVVEMAQRHGCTLEVMVLTKHGCTLDGGDGFNKGKIISG